MNRHSIKRKHIVIISFTVIVFMLAAVFIPLPYRLYIAENKSTRTVLVFPGDTKGFTLSYTHSVNRGRVKDHYEITDDRALCLSETEFVSYGAGMPEPTDDQTFTITKDSIVISGIDLKLKELILQTGVIADHHILTGDTYIVLNDVVSRGTRITIGVRRVSIYEILLHSPKRGGPIE